MTAVLGLATASLVAIPTLPTLQAVASYGASVPSVAGVRVVSTLPTLHMAVVRGDAAALQRLAASGQVTGLAPDDKVQLASDDDSEQAPGRSVLASEGLGGNAGQPGAGAGVRVAVVDTGVSDTPALNRASGRLVDAVDTSTGTSRTGGRYDDGYGHGTFMADLIAGDAAPGSNGQAIGIAPAATVLNVRVAGADGSTQLSEVLGGLAWVAQHANQVDVVNLSLSHRRPLPRYGMDPLISAVEQVRATGISVVVAAGNLRGQLGDPGFDPGAITVGAANLESNRVAPFSGSGVVAGIRKPDVVASGVHVIGLLPDDSVLAQSIGTVRLPNGLYRGTGTSQSTAIASGLAALLLQAHPHATPSQVKASLRCATVGLPGVRDGAGLVHATTALCAGPDGQLLDGSGDGTGESSFNAAVWNASSWSASSWSASSWSASSWSAWLAASSWSASSWSASSWSASSWSASSWSASSWSASSWSASSWSASSWSASSWSASSWSLAPFLPPAPAATVTVSVTAPAAATDPSATDPSATDPSTDDNATSDTTDPSTTDPGSTSTDGAQG